MSRPPAAGLGVPASLTPVVHQATPPFAPKLAVSGTYTRLSRITAPLVGGGYSHELVEVRDRLAAGATESEVMPLSDTVAVMGVLEEALHAFGVHFDEDESVEV